jgi:anti-anti-sigma factor
MRQAHGQNRTTVLVLRPEDPISAFVHLYDDVAVLAIIGELDGASAAAFKSAISAALARKPRALVIDLSDVRFLGSVGISILIQAQEKVGGGDKFALVTGGSMTGRTIRVLGLDDLFSIHPTANEAIKAIGNR